MTKTLAANEGGAGRAVLITRMLSKGVHVLTEAKVTEITEDTISYEKGGEVHTITGADTLVLAMGYRPNTKLADDLAAAVLPPTCWAMPTSAATSATPSAMATRSPASSNQPLCANRLQKAAAALCVGQPPLAFCQRKIIVGP